MCELISASKITLGVWPTHFAAAALPFLLYSFLRFVVDFFARLIRVALTRRTKLKLCALVKPRFNDIGDQSMELRRR